MKSDGMRKLTNNSGYLLQLAIEHAVRETPCDPSWRVIAREFPWRDDESVLEGFADLVLSSESFPWVRMVIECKRVRDGTWVFLQPDAALRFVSRTASFWVRRSNADRWARWKETQISPACWQSDFCVVRGTGEDSGPYLERIARRLLAAVQSIAESEIGMIDPGSQDVALLYIPVIITSADLYVANFSLDDILLKDGTLPDGKGEFAPVSYIRFHKSLSTSLPQAQGASHLRTIARCMERSVFVVNASAVLEFLDKVSFRDSSYPTKDD